MSLVISPKLERPESHALVLSVQGKTKHIIFKVAAWDPAKHPKGYKGLFVETPDHEKKGIHDVNAGDVITTKNGKIFKVEKQTPKGIKVNPVDPDTGEVKDSYTVLTNAATQVAVVQAAVVPGSQHQIGDLDVGTYVKHPKSGKRFKVTKHGNWTTVYPVDENGTVKGKHTVLPKDTVVEVVSKASTSQPNVKILTMAKDLAATIPEPGQPGTYTLDEIFADDKLTFDFYSHLAKFGDADLEEIATSLKPKTKTEWEAYVYDVWDIPPGATHDEVQFHQSGSLDEIAAWDQALAAMEKADTQPFYPDEMSIAQLMKDDILTWMSKQYGLDAGDMSEQAELLVQKPSDWRVYYADAWEAMFDEKPTELVMDEFEAIWDQANLAAHAQFAQLFNKPEPVADPAKWNHMPTLSDLYKDKELYGWFMESLATKTTGIGEVADVLSDLSHYEQGSPLSKYNWETYIADTHDSSAWSEADLKAMADNYDFWLATSLIKLEEKGPPQLTEADFKIQAMKDIAPAAIGITQPFPDEWKPELKQWMDDAFNKGNIDSMSEGSIIAYELRYFVEKKKDKAFILTATADAMKGKDITEVHDAMAKVINVAIAEAANEWYKFQEKKQASSQYDFVKAYVLHSADKAMVTAGQGIYLPDSERDDLLKWVKNAWPPEDANLDVDAQYLVDAVDDWFGTNRGYGLNAIDDGYQSLGNITPLRDAMFKNFDTLIQEARAEYSAKHAPKSKAQVLEEVMPAKLPKVPEKYAPGVGIDTRIFITDGFGIGKRFQIDRVAADGTHIENLGGELSLTAAKRVARAKSAVHERIDQVELRGKQVAGLPVPIEEYAPGTYIVDASGTVHKVASAVHVAKKIWDGSEVDQIHINFGTQKTLVVSPGTHPAWVPVAPEDLDTVLTETTISALAGEPTRISKRFYVRALEYRGLLESTTTLIRKERPTHYVAELQHEWSYDQVVGQQWVDAHKHLTPLGWREIKPRLKDQVRYVNKHGARLTLLRGKDGVVTDVAQGIGGARLVDLSTGVELADQLQAALDSSGSLESLDPRNAENPVARVSHVQHMLYDLAVGKRAGVGDKIGSGAKVKSDAAYLTELEQEGVIEPIEDFLAQATGPWLKIKARGAIIDQFNENDNPNWDFDSRMLEVNPDMSFDELAALAAILRNQGVADQILGENTAGVDTTFSRLLNPDSLARLEVGDTVWKPINTDTLEPPFGAYKVLEVEKGAVGGHTIKIRVEGEAGWYNDNDYWVKPYDPATTTFVDARLLHAAKLLAEAQRQAEVKAPGAYDDLDESTAKYLSDRMEIARVGAQEAIDASDTKKREIADNMRKQKVQDEIDSRRQAEGTVKEALSEFQLPTWDEVVLEPQTIEDIHQRTDNVPSTELALPGGAHTVRPDVPAFYTGGVIRDGIVYYQSRRADAKVLFEHDEEITGRMELLGAERGPNRNPINPGYNGSSALYDGESLVIEEPGGMAMPTFDQWGNLDEASHKRMADALDNYFKDTTSSYDWVVAMNAIAKSTPGTDDDKHAAIEKYITESVSGVKAVDIWEQATTATGRMIEYVPHKQAAGNQGGAPTSQRGRISFYGYTPEEVHAKLQDLGVVAELEPEVPYDIIMRGPRRSGLVAPIHEAYIRGEADLPKTPARITHGVTGDTSGLKSILRTGGLMAIEQRYRAGFLEKLQTTSSSGDIRSGIDHAVFCTLGQGGACGGGSNVQIVIKPNGFLRRDIVLAPQDYGGSETRYPAYRSYLNQMQDAVNITGDATPENKEQHTNLYEPVSPRVRQYHLDTVSTVGSNEFNLGPSVPIEDMEAILVPESDREAIDQLLDELMASGEIASRPKVMTNSHDDPSFKQVASQTTEKVKLS